MEATIVDAIKTLEDKRLAVTPTEALSLVPVGKNTLSRSLRRDDYAPKK